VFRAGIVSLWVLKAGVLVFGWESAAARYIPRLVSGL
jgi:hypothetical protein